MFITYFKGDMRNTTRGDVHDFAFKELATEFNKCVKGNKHSAYFVRGKLDPVQRLDENLAESKLLIIDGDEGLRGKNAPPPVDVHEALVALKINHFIYTSHSHTADVNKYRVVIETDSPMVKRDLKINTIEILETLGAQGVWIKNVKEMWTWSQPWFVPTRDDPEDGFFEFYEYHEGHLWTKVEGTAEVSIEKADNVLSDTLVDLYDNIRTGSEYHESMLNISYQLIKDGMSEAHVRAHLETLMNSSEDAGSQRWQERFNDIERTVSGASAKLGVEFELESLDDSADDEFSLPKPPGLMGELYDNCYERLLYQYPEVAMVSTIGLLAGVAGRRFNVMTPARAGLNLYLTIIAGTGFGKEGINKLINSYLRGGDRGYKDYDSFIGPSSFTGTKAIYNAFKDARSRVCVMSEAGLMMKVKSGDVEGKTAALLDAFSTSDSNSYSKFHTYSNDEDSVQSLRAMAVTIISESTPDQLMDAYRQSGALSSGYLPRQLLFKIDKRQTKVNRNVKDSQIPKAIADRLDDLLDTCSMVQAENDPKAYEMHFNESFEEEVYDFVDHWNEISAQAEIDNDEVKAKMATRVAQKTTRLAALATVFNKSRNDDDCLIIDRPEWEWAKALTECEFNRVTNALVGLQNGGTFDEAMYSIAIKLVGILTGAVKNKKSIPDRRYIRKKMVPYYMLKRACATNKHIKAIEGNPAFASKHVSGFDKALKALEDIKAIRIIDDKISGAGAKVIQAQEHINVFINEM